MCLDAGRSTHTRPESRGTSFTRSGRVSTQRAHPHRHQEARYQVLIIERPRCWETDSCRKPSTRCAISTASAGDVVHSTWRRRTRSRRSSTSPAIRTATSSLVDKQSYALNWLMRASRPTGRCPQDREVNSSRTEDLSCLQAVRSCKSPPATRPGGQSVSGCERVCFGTRAIDPRTSSGVEGAKGSSSPYLFLRLNTRPLPSEQTPPTRSVLSSSISPFRSVW